jgi:hypothetical protein
VLVRVPQRIDATAILLLIEFLALADLDHALRAAAVLARRTISSSSSEAAANTEFEDRNKGGENRHHDRDGTAGPRESPVFLGLVEI